MMFSRKGTTLAVLLVIAVSQISDLPSAAALKPAGNFDTEASLLVVDLNVTPGSEVSLIATSERPIDGGVLSVGDGAAREVCLDYYQGPPYVRMFKVQAPPEHGDWEIELADENGEVLATVKVAVSSESSAGRSSSSTGVWSIEQDWDPALERIFSFWVAHLFRPLEGQRNKGWKPLHNVLRSKTRNFLYNRLGHDEDNPESDVHIRAKADCGDLPYQLRAYFCWKFALPFRYRDCNRGSSRNGPRCRFSVDNREDKYDRIAHPVARFNAFIRESIAWGVHSGTMRTLPEDEKSDFYPIALNRRSIRPGTVFVDVGGHALMVTQWNRDGLFAVDGHPDKTVTRKRFSPKDFKHFAGVRTGGFKAFRPVKMQGEEIVPISSESALPSFSLEQYSLSSKTQFLERMHDLITVL